MKFNPLDTGDALNAALARVMGNEPPLNRLNRVPAIYVRYQVQEASPIITMDVVDDPVVPVGERPRVAFSAKPVIEWWGAARRVHYVGDIPRKVGELHEMLIAKMLGLA